jgi:hypothetical protein
MAHCPECGGVWQEGVTCQDAFYQMLFWETEDPLLGQVHHLMVPCYQIQHPAVLSSKGLSTMIWLLGEFMSGMPPAEVRARMRDKVSSNNRDWTVTARPEDHGAYANPVRWSMTAGDVVARGKVSYCHAVREWAASVLEALKASGYVPAMPPQPRRTP